MEKSAAEFFAGTVLMRLGLEKAGWRAVFASDIDEDKRRVYCGHFGGDGRFLLADVREIDASKAPAAALATASFPCNDLSFAGARKGLAGRQSSAFFISVPDRLKTRKPPLVLMENVTGFLTSRGGLASGRPCLR